MRLVKSDADVICIGDEADGESRVNRVDGSSDIDTPGSASRLHVLTSALLVATINESSRSSRVDEWKN